MLSTKTRLSILFLGMGIFLGAVTINQILILADSALNPLNINLYQTSTTISYSWENGTLGHNAALNLEITAGSSGQLTSVKATKGNNVTNYQCDYDTGEFIMDGKKSGNYTIFWIPVNNPMLNAWTFQQFENTSVIDPVGILGAVNTSYTLVIGEKKVYWETPQAMDGAQFSFVVLFYDENNVKVAEGLMDSTCGFLETLEGGPDHATLTVSDTGLFLVSRNRYNILLWTPIIAGIASVVLLVLMKKREISKEIQEEVMLLLGIAISVDIVDIIIDVWFYSWLGMDGMLYLHLGLFAVYSLICLRLGYGIKWAYPAFLEVAFVFVMNRFVGDPYVPHITAFMGLFAAYLAILFRSGFPKRDKRDKLSLLF